MAKVILRKVSKTYPGENSKDVVAVQHLDLEVQDREFVVLVGPSGCGKSTTLRMIAGLENVTSGEIFIGDKAVNNLPPQDRDIAMVFQNYALYPHLSVFENMAFGLKFRNYGNSEIKKRVNEAAAILGIEDLLGRKPGGLSGGQQQRVAVGRAIVRQPKVFLFDEPLSNLDAKMRVQMRAELTKLHQRLQGTMIYVTHDQTEAMTMGNRIVVMKDGVAQQTNAPLELYRHPANTFVAGFLGSPPMNFIRGTLKQTGDQLVFRETDGVIEVKMDAASHEAARAFAGREVILGVRPEQLEPAPNAPPKSDHVFQALVDIVEPMGAETNFYLHTGSHTVICRSPSADRQEGGHRMRFSIQAAKVLLFDPATTARIG